jgi:superfamily I DNA/RNA helicase
VPTVDELVAAGPEQHGELIAGPGAGKSFTIGRRVDSLRAQGVENDDIVLLTLTNATARTLRDRFPAVPVRTVHTYTLTALAQLGALAGRSVADRWEQKELVRRDMQFLAAEGGHNYRVDAVDDFLTAYGTGFRDEPSAEPLLTDDEAVLRAVWERVREFLVLHVFDDFASELDQLLAEGRRLSNPPRAVVVDEYQDLTAIELRLIRTIATQGDAGVFACGDDMQSIYGFRDAATNGLSGFPALYGIDEAAYLSVSRRCPKPVIDLAEEVAERAPGRAALAPRPRMTSLDDRDGELRVLAFPSLVAEMRWIVRDIARRKVETPEDKIDVIVPGSMKVYVPALNAASEHCGLDLTFGDSRKSLGIDGDHGFRFAYAVLRIASDRDDQLAWRTVLKVVPYQPAVRVSQLYNGGSTPLTVAIRARMQVDASLASLYNAINDLGTAVSGATSRDEVTDAINGAATALRVGAIPWDTLLEVLEEPVGAEEEAVDETTPEHARDLLAAARRAVSSVAADREPAANEILVYTVFQAKGQEWDHVYLVGAYRRGFRDQHAVGEGTRLLYVALTRAIKSLTISKFNSTTHNAGLLAATGTPTPAFPTILVEAIAASGHRIEEMGPQA